jgi:hypothetical protein
MQYNPQSIDILDWIRIVLYFHVINFLFKNQVTDLLGVKAYE